MIGVSVNPDNVLVYAASKGREFLDMYGHYQTAPMDAAQKALLKRVNARLKQLVENPQPRAQPGTTAPLCMIGGRPFAALCVTRPSGGWGSGFSKVGGWVWADVPLPPPGGVRGCDNGRAKPARGWVVRENLQEFRPMPGGLWAG